MILVWLRMAASADPPSAPMLLFVRLQARVQVQCMLRGADTNASTVPGLRAEANLRLVICVYLSTAAMALPPSAPMTLRPMLRVQAKCNVKGR